MGRLWCTPVQSAGVSVGKRKWWTWPAMAAVVAGMVAGWWWTRPQPAPSVAATALGWQAQAWWLAGAGQPGPDNGPARQARFAEPWGLARDGLAGLYISDAGDNNRIRYLDIHGQLQTVAGSSEGYADGPAAQARLHTPSGIALAADGALYIADTGNHAVRVLRDGAVSTLAGNGQPGDGDGPAAQARFDAPMAVAVATDGRVYVADTFNDRIAVIGADGQVRTLAGGGGPGRVDGQGTDARFDTPTGLAIDGHGVLWVADLGNDAIRRVYPDGRVDTVVGGEAERQLWQPQTLAITADGVLYIGERLTGRVVQRSVQGHLSTVFGSDPANRLSRPAGLALTPEGGLLVSDAGGMRLHWLRTQPAGEASVSGAIGPDPARALPATAGRWPLAPQRGWHEVVGTLGEVRGTFAGKNRNHLHAGFDIRGDVGQPVLAIADGKVSSPLAAWSPNGQAEGLAVADLDYIHMRVGRTPQGQAVDPRFELLRDARGRVQRVRVRRGTRFAAGEVLGTINAQAHVHLQVGPAGYERNAIALGFTGFTDSVAPVIEDIRVLDGNEQVVGQRREGYWELPRSAGLVQVAVQARDQVDGNLARRRLGLYALGWQLLDAAGTPLPGYEQPLVQLEFNRMPPQGDAVLHAYGPDSGITVHGSAVTRFQYLVTNTVRDGRMQRGGLDVGALPAGDYRLRISARDWHGNQAVEGRELRLRLL